MDRKTMLLGLIGLAAGCTSEPALPDLTQIYATVAEAGVTPARRPLITIPGTLGSKLRDRESGTVVWGGGSRGLSADPEDPVEARLIALPVIAPEAPLSALRDGVEADGVLDLAEPKVLGIPLSVEVYGGVRRTLTAGGFRSSTRSMKLALRLDPGGGSDEPPAAPEPAGPGPEDYARIVAEQANSFRFDYDWRRDLPMLAGELHDFLMVMKREVAAARALAERRSVSPDEVRFDLLAHSMGGLLARYYLMHGAVDLPADGSLPPVTWAGAEHFSRVVIVATPNAGSILAMDNIVNGKTLGPLQPFYPGALLATHASVWQLFPRGRHGRVRARGAGGAAGGRLDPLDPELWERHRWGLLDPGAAELRAWLMPEIADEPARLEQARLHQARLMRRAEQFHRAIDRWGTKPDHLEMFLVVGGGFATPAAAEVDPETGAFTIVSREEGDGVVLRSSVLLDERQGRAAPGALITPLRFDQILFLPDEHVELTKNPVFGDNLLFWLLEQPRQAEGLAEPSAGLLTRRAPAAAPASATRAAESGRDR